MTPTPTQSLTGTRKSAGHGTPQGKVEKVYELPTPAAPIAVPADLPVVEVDLEAGTVCGIVVDYERVPEHLDNAVSVGTMVEATESAALVRLNSMRLLVQNGERITVDPEPGLAPEAVWFALYGWAASLVMLQRGHYFLHASTVRRGEQVIALTGQRGAGKSTTALELAKRGWLLNCDDTTPIAVIDGQAWIAPYRRPIHLLPGAEPQGLVYSHDLPERVKQAFIVEQDLDPRPLTAVIELVIDAQLPPRSDVQLRQVTGASSIALLERNIHAWRAARAPGRRQSLMAWLSGVATATQQFSLTRPTQAHTLARICDEIESLPTDPEGRA